ncbi:hypothetical protein LTR70_000367 [Exophiala xenobiotica]|uniref:F-box domain-containing protein n=1 Tax=Lithohypha guttulata TaxID=1690604 RepID=A0ABR0KQ16_9EURO|nr:hypothetical protein LTR24_000070 [Lithohypha guttulata]KAK5330537.1 hypothetical protein LTR70_000367 [Exophiala xenobiotica]
MGYSEIYCHICGVSFNIGRVRAPHEPRSAAWDSSGYRDGDSFVDNRGTDECERNSGCMRVYREDRAMEIWKKREEDDDDVVMDADYVPDIPGGDGHGDDSGRMDYEYETPSEICSEAGASEDGDDMPVESSASDSEYRHFEEEVRKLCVTLKDKFPDVRPDGVDALRRAEVSQTKSEDEVMLPLSQALQGRDEDAASTDFRDNEIWEHIAGLGCVNINGYNGNRISAEEMRGCNTSQALIPKADVAGGWQPSERDEPWEQACTFFLSGLDDSMPDREDLPSFFPERNGFGEISAENIIWDAGDPGYAMPFHPACLEAYKRASLKRHGSFEIEALASWWQLTATYDEFDDRWAGAVSRGQVQWWNHTPGDEYLAANPCIVPRLKQILESACRTTPGTKNASQLSQQLVKPSSFEALPAEIHRQIFGYLSAVDVARTCIAADCVRALAQAYIRDRLLIECPYFWELWCDKPYSQWVDTTAKELKSAAEDLKSAADSFASEEQKAEHILEILKEEGQNQAREAFERYWSDIREGRRNTTHEGPCLKTNYTSLAEGRADFVQLAIGLNSAVEQDQVKGLKNRERIWTECQRILDRIEDFRRQGKVRQDGTVTPGASSTT